GPTQPAGRSPVGPTQPEVPAPLPGSLTSPDACSCASVAASTSTVSPARCRLPCGSVQSPSSRTYTMSQFPPVMPGRTPVAPPREATGPHRPRTSPRWSGSLVRRFAALRPGGILDAVSCPRCGRTAREGDRFCGGCGVELTAVCRACGRTLAADVAYCTGCGTAREAPQPTLTLPTEERRRVSVLFVDLVDSTLYAERSDPELVRRMQTAFYATARRVVRQYGGVVEKYIGDAVMALFGAPVATETDALRCVRAGLELQRALPASVASIDPQLRFRIGIATGEALVDLAAARDGGQGIVVGDVVNTAARLQAVAPSGGVLVCGHTQALTRDTVHYRAQPPVVLRGRSTPTEVWLALEAVQRSETEPDALPLVEREHELSLLVNALNRTVYEGVPQLVTIFGQAGSGKGRPVRGLPRPARRREPPPAWRVGHCPPFGEDVTYAGLAEIVKAEVGIRDTDPAESVRARLFEATRRVCPPGEAERVARALGALVGLPDAADLPLQEV